MENSPDDSNKYPQQVVSLEYRVWQSFEGRYFIGHTPLISICGCENAWGGLYNPPDSNLNLYLNTFTVSNTSEMPFKAQLWLNAHPMGKVYKSPYVSPANTALTPPPAPKAKLIYAQNERDLFSNGASLFTRIAEAKTTVVGNYYGKIIVPPGGSIYVYLYSPGMKAADVEIAMGWWEND